MGDDELDDAVPMTPAEKAVSFFKGEEDSPLKPKEITEEMLARLFDNMQEMELLAKLIEQDKKDLKELARGEETVTKGKFAAFFQTRKGRKTVDWQEFIKSQIGKPTEEDLKPYTKVSEDSVSVSVKKIL